MSYNAYDINVLVNGRRCKQHVHEGKTYIESKDGSKYTLEIKNNTGNRILVISSVDGLNVLSGENASPSDSGYVVDPYSKVEIKGFRYSDDNVGAFEFTRKKDNDSYAATKGNQKNCGVIGFRLYNEIYRPIWRIQNCTLKATPWPVWGGDPYDQTYTTCIDDDLGVLRDESSEYKCSSTNKGESLYSANITSRVDTSMLREVKSKGFDMATKWGEKLESKVTNVEFERGCLCLSLDIYYASRDSLIDMGVPITKHQKVSSPESFPGTYAKPPKGWKA